MISAFNTNYFSLISYSHHTYATSIKLTSLAHPLPFVITNIYAPSNRKLKQAFLDELNLIKEDDQTPWLIVGDFNLIRFSHEKNKRSFRQREAGAFNSTINALALIELPLLDRRFTWSNKRASPTLERLDRAFFNLAWNNVFPNTTLSSLPRITSDHVPLILNIQTTVPKTRHFRFESAWTLSTACQQIIQKCWAPNHRSTQQLTSAAALAKALKRTRYDLKNWASKRSPAHLREAAAKQIINLIDLKEEARTLSNAEKRLRFVVSDTLHSAIAEKIAFWKQRGKVRAAIDGEENTQYFHAAASQRLRKNTITSLLTDGTEFHSHAQKATILKDHFTALIGSAPHTYWPFDPKKYYPQTLPQLNSLDSPFTLDEIKNAFLQMNPLASPGPDGFGPLFYKKYWNLVKAHIHSFMTDFQNLNAQTESLNRAHLILLPKKDHANTADAYRPISLQNCPIKAVAKVLTNRLKPIIPLLVHGNQTGFIPGRSIAENFIFAADLIGACHTRKAPTMVIKLDFSKAFDNLSWDSLTSILRCRGFPPKFSSWVHDLLATGKTAVMLNGIPGNWINCKNGLRQGDPISPYLFIIVADLLQQMIQQDCDLAHLSHPLFSHLPPTVLQYADDTLIIAKASNPAAQQLKYILHDFAMATGLTINFTKTTFVPMHISTAMVDSIASTLHCPTSSFPQIYLGLPLTPTRLPTNAFLPIIERCRKFLTGWRAKILSKGDRLILLSAVLDSLLVYFMSVFPIPKSVLKTLDSSMSLLLGCGGNLHWCSMLSCLEKCV